MARAGNGHLERSGPLFPDDPVAELDGVTLAVGPDGEVEGYVGWDRGEGYGRDARLIAYDVVGRTGRATTALVIALGTWSAVTPTLSLRLPDPDPVAWLLPTAVPTIRSVQPWMLRLVDAPRAVAARGWPAHLQVTLELDLRDDTCPWNAGRFRLEVERGAGRLTPGGRGSTALGPRGLALLYGGGVSPALLRRAGLLEGGDRADDQALDALAAGPRPALLDYF